MKLNEQQKDFLFNTIFGNNKQEIYKIFDTISIGYLKKQKIELGKADKFGWIPLIMNGEELTMLNFPVYEKEWGLIWNLK